MSEIQLIQGDCLEEMKKMDSEIIDLTVTSPPYDNLRTYNGNNKLWNEDVWKGVIEQLYRLTKEGGVGVVNILRIYYGKRFRAFLWKTPPQ